MGMSTEVDSDDVEAYWPGLDCMVNCNLALLNVAKAEPLYDEGGLHRSAHPGAGAISPYHNGTTWVKRSIPAGGELFKYYGKYTSEVLLQRCYNNYVHCVSHGASRQHSHSTHCLYNRR